MVASSDKRLKKITKLSEISLKDFTDKAQNEVLNWFSMTPAHWVMLHRVMISFFKASSKYSVYGLSHDLKGQCTMVRRGDITHQRNL